MYGHVYLKENIYEFHNRFFKNLVSVKFSFTPWHLHMPLMRGMINNRIASHGPLNTFCQNSTGLSSEAKFHDPIGYEKIKISKFTACIKVSI